MSLTLAPSDNASGQWLTVTLALDGAARPLAFGHVEKFLDRAARLLKEPTRSMSPTNSMPQPGL